jgi:hypothetical protein
LVKERLEPGVKERLEPGVKEPVPGKRAYMPEIKDKLLEHLNEMVSAENAAVDRLHSRIQECLLLDGKQQ